MDIKEEAIAPSWVRTLLVCEPQKGGKDCLRSLCISSALHTISAFA